MTAKKYVYYFTEGNKDMKEILGGKGANLAEMTNLGVPVPPGFTITTNACALFSETNEWPEGMAKQVDKNLAKLEEQMGARFGDNENPLLVSVRSGAAVSMPGMMDTVLNLGLNDKTVEALGEKSGNERFAWDSYRRFIQMFGDVDMGVSHKYFEEVLQKTKETKGVEYDTELDADDLKKVVGEYKKIIKEHAGREFPQEPREQLRLAINAVFGSWNNKRAVAYRIAGHSSQCASHGFWEYERELSNRGLLYKKSGNWRECFLR
jgi:pyruvate,orthophosphate dikinase